MLLRHTGTTNTWHLIQWIFKYHRFGFPGLNHLGTLLPGLRLWFEFSLPVRFIPLPFLVLVGYAFELVLELAFPVFVCKTELGSFTFFRIPQSMSERSTPVLLDSWVRSSGFRYRISVTSCWTDLNVEKVKNREIYHEN